MRPIKRAAPAVPFLFLAACTVVPEETERARGVLEGMNLVLALSVLVVVVAVGMIGAALVIDRMVRTRRLLGEEAPATEEEPEEEDEVVAGLTVGRAAVPRWLYGAYVLIPVFAFAYVFSNIAPEQVATEPTPEPAPSGPCTECEIAAAQIAFETEELEVAADSEITVTFNNNDTGVPHDFAVYDSPEPGGEPVAKTPVITGTSSADMSFESPAAGETWSFNCTVHPQAMVGTIESVEG